MNFENIYPRVSPVDCVCNAHLLADWCVLAPDQKRWLPGWAGPPADWEGRGISGQWLILDRHLVLGSDTYQSSPLTVPPAGPPWPSAISPQSSSFSPAADLSCWGTTQLQDEEGYVNMSEGFQAQAYSRPGWQPAEQGCWPVPPLTPPSHQGEPHFWGEAGDTLPHLSPGCPHHASSVVVEPTGHRGAGRRRPRRCVPSQRWPRRGLGSWSLSSFSYQLQLTPPGASPRGATFSEHPEQARVHPSSQTKTQERFATVLAWVDKTSAWICSVMTGLWMRACSYKLNKTFSDLSHIMVCLLIPLPEPETSRQIYNRGISYCPPQLDVSGTSRLVSCIETESIYLSPLTILTLGESHLQGVIPKQSYARGVRRSLSALLFFTQDWSNLSSNSSQSPHPVCVFPEFSLMECIFPVERTEEFRGKN